MAVCLLDARRSREREPERVGDPRIVVPLFVERGFERMTLPAGCEVDPLFLDRLIPTETFHALADRALRCRDRFLELARGDEALDGPDTLMIFRGDELHYFFREILYAQAAAQALLGAGFERIDFRPGTGGGGPSPGEVFYRALAAAFEAAGEGGRLRRLPGSSVVVAGRGLGLRLGNAWRKLRNRLEPFYARPPVAGRCVAIFSSSQWRRFRGALADLRSHYGEGFVFWYLGRIDAAVRRHAAKSGVALSQIPLPPALDTDVVRYFERRHRVWLGVARHRLAEEMACPALAAPGLEGDFELLFRSTLPHAVQWTRVVARHLAATAPELVVGSAAFTQSSAMPLLAAEHLGIPSLALSHTYISGDHGPVPSRWLACRNGFERRGYRRVVAEEQRIVYCRNASDALSYEVSAAGGPAAGTPAAGGGGRKRVALLTASPQVATGVMPLHELGPWVRTLLALARPPDELAEVEWVFKFHPRFDMSPHLEGLDLPANVRVVPATASVHELLAESWLAVLVEHVGGVGIDARLAGVPLVFLDSAHYRFPQVEPRNFEAEGVANPEALWRLVGELLDEPDQYRQLVEKNRVFVERWLGPADSTLADRLRAGLAEGSGRDPEEGPAP